MSVSRVVDVCNRCRKFCVDFESVVSLYRLLDNCEYYEVRPGELSVSFVSPKKMRQLHGQYIGDNSSTDVITFLGDESLDFAGEIVVCPEYALNRTKDFGTTLEQEVTLYLIHGFLHLSGIKDKTPADAAKMRYAETVCQEFIQGFTVGITIKA